MKPSEEIELGDTGQFLKDGIIVDKNGDPIKKVCPGCKNPEGKCTCELVDVDVLGNEEEWHH